MKLRQPRDCTILTDRVMSGGTCVACGVKLAEETHIPNGPRPGTFCSSCCPACAPLPDPAEVAAAVGAARESVHL